MPGTLPLTFRMGAACEHERLFITHHDQISGCMAFAAMAGAVYQIGAAVPCGCLAAIGLPGGGVQTQKFPQAQSTAQEEGKR